MADENLFEIEDVKIYTPKTSSENRNDTPVSDCDDVKIYNGLL